jgi:hypothetical protein
MKMTTTTMLMKEIETLPEESMAEDIEIPKPKRISIKDAYGIFNGIDTHFERDEEEWESLIHSYVHQCLIHQLVSYFTKSYWTCKSS